SANATTYDAVVTIPSTQTWYVCSQSNAVKYEVDLLDGNQKNTSGVGVIVPGYPTQADPGAPAGFLTVLATKEAMNNYIDSNFSGNVNIVTDASCVRYKPIVPVSNCTKSGPVSPSDTYCLAVTNPQPKSIQVGVNCVFDDVKVSATSNNTISTKTTTIIPTIVLPSSPASNPKNQSDPANNQSNPANNPANNQSNKNTMILGAIIGGSVVGVVAIVIGGLIIFLFYWKRKNSTSINNNISEDNLRHAQSNEVVSPAMADIRHYHSSQVVN
ncbi:8696_t:CDS:2, partial [Ambispora leptoticha]